MGCACLLAAFAGCGGQDAPADELASLGSPIVNGEPDDSEQHAAVVAVTYQSGVEFGLCSGTLITPTVVLTAAHCVFGSLDEHSVVFGTNAFRSRVSRSIVEVRKHTRWNGDAGHGYDIALVRLASPAPDGTVPIPPLPDFMGLGEGDVGEELIFVGYGQTETGQTDGVKRWALGYLQWICAQASCQYMAPYTLCYDQHPGGPCQGDSGGPSLVTREGREYVAGITSFGGASCLEDPGCSTKVDAFTDFITDFTGGGIGQACSQDDECLFGYCADGLCCDSACDQPCRACDLEGHEGHCWTAPSGTPCSDGDLCNGEETCILGDCSGGGEPLDCDDGDICTHDSCNARHGCVNEPEPDGFVCGQDRMCQAGQCVPCGSSGCATAGAAGSASAAVLLLLLLTGWRRR
ncbi:MAG: trypsin-like serine protease [Deltaproteobacteria bacterium]|nr:trypsin-like serine protease [Deltaproteobacteria bacterium]